MTLVVNTQERNESEEADPLGLALARAEGMAFGRTLHHMIEEVADSGAEIAAGEYLIAYAVEKAEGLYVPDESEGFVWQAPRNENVHIEIAVRDRADGRLIPALDVVLTVIDPNGKELGTHKMPLLWHPYLYHYGRNWRLPGDGRYSLRVHFPPPQFKRHDRKNGTRFASGADVTFRDVEIKTGGE